MRRPHDVEHPWPRKSNIASKIFQPPPQNAKRQKTEDDNGYDSNNFHNYSTLSLVVHAVDSPLVGLHFPQEQDGLVFRVEET